MDVAALALRAVVAGALVAAFAMLGEVLGPKVFAGLFSGAPSVAIANLTVLAAMKGSAHAGDQSAGMVLGGVAFIVAALVGAVFVRRLRAMRDSVLVYVTWVCVAFVGLAVVAR